MTGTTDKTRSAKRTAKALVGKMSTIGRCFCDGARMMIGVPNYDAYVAHVRATHPDAPVMTYEEFFRNRLDARFGGGTSTRGFRCC